MGGPAIALNKFGNYAMAIARIFLWHTRQDADGIRPMCLDGLDALSRGFSVNAYIKLSCRRAGSVSSQAVRHTQFNLPS